MLASSHCSSKPPHHSSNCHDSFRALCTLPQDHPAVHLTVTNRLWLLTLHLISTPPYVSFSQNNWSISLLASEPTHRSYHCQNLSPASCTSPQHHPTVHCTVTNRLRIVVLHLTTTLLLVSLSQSVSAPSLFTSKPPNRSCDCHKSSCDLRT